MKLMSYKDCLELGKAMVEKALIPIRIQQAKMSGQQEQLKIDESLIKLEIEIQELSVANPIIYGKIIDKLNEVDLLTRRIGQFDKIISELFPEEKVVAKAGK